MNNKRVIIYLAKIKPKYRKCVVSQVLIFDGTRINHQQQ